MKPSRSSIHKEIVCLRQVLKCANRRGWLPYLPDLTQPFRGPSKISHRAWFSPAEYKHLYEATRRRVENPPKPRWRRSCEQLHDYVLFMANTRPQAGRSRTAGIPRRRNRRGRGDRRTHLGDRGARQTRRRLLQEHARSRHPLRALAKPSAPPAQRRGPRRRATADEKGFVRPQPTDSLFDRTHRELFKTVLEEEGMTVDRDGNRRTSYSLRHTYICLRLMEGADIYQIAKNCRTSVEMIEKYYAAHLKNTLDASRINVRKEKVAPKRKAAARGDSSSPPGRYARPRPPNPAGKQRLKPCRGSDSLGTQRRLSGRGGTGRRNGLRRLSARGETRDVELLKFGEP